MTGTQLAALVRYKTKTNSTTLTDAQIIVLANIFKDEIAGKIVERNSAYFQLSYPFNLVANTRQYAFQSNYLDRMQKLELAFASGDALTPSRFIKDYQGSETESEIVKNYSNAPGEFAHTIRARGIFILSGTVPTLSNGGRLLYHVVPSDLSAIDSTELASDPSATTFGMPKKFHELWARRISIEYKGALPKPQPLSALERNYETDLESALAEISHQDNSGEIVANSLPDNDTGHDGFDY